MRYQDFKNRVSGWPIILSREVLRFGKNHQALRNQLSRWQKQGLVVKLRRGIYLLNESDRKIQTSRAFVANQLYRPSYVSLEYALGFYGLIPEQVIDMTSVTTRKTACFRNELGNFSYQHLSPGCFRGFRAATDEAGVKYFLAEPEKAVVDFLYFKLPELKGDAAETLKESFRFQNTTTLKPKRILTLAGLWQNRRLMSAAHAFCKLIGKEAKS